MVINLVCRLSYMDNFSGSSSQDLAYDLRQRYAKIVGDHLEDLAIHRRERKYSDYFRALEDLYTIVKHKFKNKTTKIKVIVRKEGAKDEIKEKVISYTSLRVKAIEVSNDFPNAWSGAGMETEEIAEVEKALRAIEMFLYAKMDEANMFGSKRELEGLI